MVQCRCLFCQSLLLVENQDTWQASDTIKCESCGEVNDVASIRAVAKQEAIVQATEQATAELNKKLKSIFKK